MPRARAAKSPPKKTRERTRDRGLGKMLAAIERALGPGTRPPSRSAWELILRENVAYLVDDERREATFAALAAQIGVSPEAIAEAPASALRAAIAAGGMMEAGRAEKLRRCAALALDPKVGPPDAALGTTAARRVLRKYPGIGEPGADKLLLFTGTEAVPTVESAGLRVLARLGVVAETGRYDADYRAARAALGEELGGSARDLERAYFLLRALGQERCKKSAPLCGDCPVRGACPSAMPAPAATTEPTPAATTKKRPRPVS